MRRSMNQALRPIDLPPEAIALIREGRPMPQAVPVLDENPEPTVPNQPEPKPKVTRKLENKPIERQPVETGSTLEVRSVSRSFRLPENLLVALLRASTERRISRIKPFTQEEMVADAIREWLTKNRLL